MKSEVPVKFASSELHNRSRRMRTQSVRPVVWCLILAVSLTRPVLSQDLHFTTREEKPDGSFVANTRQAFNSTSSLTTPYFYTIVSGANSDHFQIDSSNGDLFTSGILDREALCPGLETCDLGFQVTRTSGFGSHIVSIVVSLEDENDNPPVFSQPQLTLTIPEDAALGVRYPLPEATDLDSDPQNKVQSYSLSPPNGDPFELVEDSRLYLVVSGHLDHEMILRYNLVLTARDSGNSSSLLQGHMNVTVLVEDVNDNPPLFERARYTVQLGTNTSSHYHVVTVTAVDRDQGDNAIFQYRLAASQESPSIASQFQVDSHTGELFTLQPLPVGQHVVVVEAVDQGNPPLVSHTEVEVNVIAQENTCPVISLTTFNPDHPWVVIDESANAGAAVAHVSVSDSDSGSNGMVYCSVSSPEFMLQSLVPGVYVVRLASQLDRELQASYDVTITCGDMGNPPLTASQVLHIRVRDANDNAPVFINVLDMNDNTPQFPAPNYNFSVVENSPSGTVIGKVTAFDIDAGVNSLIDYSLLSSPSQHSSFNITSDGFLLTTASFDREAMAVHHLLIAATDRGTPALSATAQVEVNVIDVNDNVPVFLFPTPGSSVTLNLPVADTQVVTVMQAYDVDEGRNSAIVYSLMPQTSSLFQIDEYSGELYTTRALTAQDVGVHNLTVTVMDGGLPPLTSQTMFAVIVNDQ